MMTDFFDKMWELEQEKSQIFKQFQGLSHDEQALYLSEKLSWENYEKMRTNFFLEILDNYHFDEEVLRKIWKTWLKICIYHEFRKREAIVSFLWRNPHLKPEAIAEIFHIIETNPIRQTNANGTLETDEVAIYNAVLILWDLEYKKGLQEFIKKYKNICDLYLDEEDYKKINALEEK